jgi:hypothetical protein
MALAGLHGAGQRRLDLVANHDALGMVFPETASIAGHPAV